MKPVLSSNVKAIVLVLSFTASGIAAAGDGSDFAEYGLIYNNRAHVQETGFTLDSDSARTIENAEIVYVNNAYGPAIYSYAGQVNPVSTMFNVEYVDTAHGQAIYSYPNNNPRHRLELSAAPDVTDRNIVPAGLTIRFGAVRNGEATVTP